MSAQGFLSHQIGMSPKDRSKLAADNFASRLKAARKSAGLTQEALGALAEIAPITLSKLETGATTPTFEVLVAIAHALNAPPNYLAGWDETHDMDATGAQRLAINQLILAARKLPTDWIGQITSIAEKMGSPTST